MGQSLSQPEASTGAQDEADQGKNDDKKPKSRKRKRKSAEVEQDLDEIESQTKSARALLQLREGAGDVGAIGYDDDIAASQQLVTETSQPRSPQFRNGIDSSDTSLQKSMKTQNSHRKTRKKQSSAGTDLVTPNQVGDGGPPYAQLPSTPPEKVDRSLPTPFCPSISQSHHALDEVSTDDEAVIFDQEFGNSAASEEPPVIDPDIYSFSQQPQESHSQQDPKSPPYSLPDISHRSSDSHKTRKDKKRKKAAESEILDEGQALSAAIEGQHLVELAPTQETFSNTCPNPHFAYDTGFADYIRKIEGNEIPVDPVLYSINALPPAVDLSALHYSNNSAKPRKTTKLTSNGSVRPTKSKQIEDSGAKFTAINGNDDPFATHGDQENIQDYVLPGIEDPNRQTSPEHGTPSIGNSGRNGLEYHNSASKSAKGAKRKQPKQDSKHAPTTPSQRSPKEKESGRSIKELSAKGGPWSIAEFAKLEDFRNKYCDANQITQKHFNTLIQTHIKGNPEVAALYKELHELIPYRPRISVQKCARRRFHNYASRGSWTAEEDEGLRLAVEEKGKSWKVVGDMIDRFPADCRDRWRNYIYKAENRQKEQWSDEEVRALCAGILKCMDLMRAERRQAREEEYGSDASDVEENSDQEGEDLGLINWQIVSDHMENRRSRLQCSLKWGQIKKNDQKSALRRIIEAGGLQAPKKPSVTKNRWRRKMNARRFANMRTGDRYDLVRAILYSDASTEENIPWVSLGDQRFRSVWRAPEKKLGWQKLKASVPDSNPMDYRQIAQQIIVRMEAEGADELENRWNPEVHGDFSKRATSNRSRSRKSMEASKEALANGEPRIADRRRTSAMSDELVHESDDDDEVNIAHEPEDYDPYDIPPSPGQVGRYADGNHLPASCGGELDFDGNGNASDSDSLFMSRSYEGEQQPTKGGSVSPEMANRIQSLRHFMPDS